MKFAQRDNTGLERRNSLKAVTEIIFDLNPECLMIFLKWALILYQWKSYQAQVLKFQFSNDKLSHNFQTRLGNYLAR